MKYISLLASLLLTHAALACPVCERAKAKTAFGSFSHGPAPGSVFDYVIVWLTIAIAVAVLAFAIKKLIRPGEQQTDHIKYTILQPPSQP